MLHLSSPSGLFENKKVYHISGDLVTSVGKLTEKVIVIYQHNSEKLPEPLQQMLDKLLVACKFDLAGTAYFNVEIDKDITLGLIQEKYPAQIILLFGETGLERNLLKLKKNIPLVINGIKILQADSLSALNGNDKEKKALWGGLQKMLAL